MASEIKCDFGQLYRRAFAEKNPLLKSILLQQVQAELDEWRQSNARFLPHPEQSRSRADVCELPQYRERRQA
jgi:hypothetical protein